MKLRLQQLEAHLWGAANILRGKTAGQDYKNYILSYRSSTRVGVARHPRGRTRPRPSARGVGARGWAPRARTAPPGETRRDGPHPTALRSFDFTAQARSIPLLLSQTSSGRRSFSRWRSSTTGAGAAQRLAAGRCHGACSRANFAKSALKVQGENDVTPANEYGPVEPQALPGEGGRLQRLGRS